MNLVGHGRMDTTHGAMIPGFLKVMIGYGINYTV